MLNVKNRLLAQVLPEWKTVLGAPLAAGLLAYGLTYLIPPRFTATTVFLPPQQQQSAASTALQSIGMLTGLAGGSLGLKSPIDQFVSLTLSTTICDRIIDQFDLMKIYDEDLRVDARKELLKRARAVAGKDGLITLEVDDTDPQRASQMANAFVAQLDQLVGRLALSEAQQRRAFFEQQIAKVKAKLSEAEAALQRSGVGSGTLRASPEAAVAQLAELTAKVAETEVELQTLRSRMTDNAPEVQQAKQVLAALLSQAAALDKTNAGGSDAGYIGRVREFKYQEALYEMLSKQYELAKVDEAREGTSVQIVDIASPPERKSSPKRAVLASIASALVLLAALLRVRSAAPLVRD